MDTVTILIYSTSAYEYNANSNKRSLHQIAKYWFEKSIFSFIFSCVQSDLLIHKVPLKLIPIDIFMHIQIMLMNYLIMKYVE